MDTDETAAVRQAAEDFYAALNAMFTGDLAPMESVWSHRDDVSYLGPGGDFRVGWADVRESWQEQADMKLGGTVEPSDMQITVGGDLAIAQIVRSARTPTRRAGVGRCRSGRPISSERKTAFGR